MDITEEITKMNLYKSSRRNQITLSAPHRTVRAVFPHTALRIVLGVYSLHLISCSSVYI